MMHAKIARFLIWTGKGAMVNPNALGGDMELTDPIYRDGCALGLDALRRLPRPRVMGKPPHIALDDTVDGRGGALRSTEDSEPHARYPSPRR